MSLSAADWGALFLTLRLAITTTVILLIIGTPLAWWLSKGQSWLRYFVEAVVALPLILPPTVLGFYLLVALGNQSPLGQFLNNAFGIKLVFSFSGLVVGSIVYSMPFVIQPLQNIFSSIGDRPLEVAATLGAGPLDRFRTIIWPLARPGYLTAAVLGFAHTVGEFGVVLMIGGNIPEQTRVLSIAIYDHVEALRYGEAHTLSAILLVFSFVMLLLVYAWGRKNLARMAF